MRNFTHFCNENSPFASYIMPTATISDVLRQQNIGSTLEVKGWVRTFRSNRFIALNDGSCQGNVQCVVDFESFSEVLLKRVTTGASISVTGEVVASQGSGQAVEIMVKKLEVLGDCPTDSFPLQPKRHSLELDRKSVV